MPCPQKYRDLLESEVAKLTSPAKAADYMKMDGIHHTIAEALHGDKTGNSQWRFAYNPKEPVPWKIPDWATSLQLALKFFDYVKTFPKFQAEWPMMEHAAVLLLAGCQEKNFSKTWDGWDWMTSYQVPVGERLTNADWGWNETPNAKLYPKYTLADLPKAEPPVIEPPKEEPMPNWDALIEDALKHNENAQRYIVQADREINLSNAKLREALQGKPVEPPKPDLTPPQITNVAQINDYQQIQYEYTSDYDWFHCIVEGGEGVQEAFDKDSPLTLTANGQGTLNGAISVSGGKFTGKVKLSIAGADANQNVITDYTVNVLDIPTSKPSFPEIPEKPIEPNGFPFPLQNRGETPKLIRKPDEVIDITDLAQGSHREMNHPSRRGFEAPDKDGKVRRCIAGSARTIINLETKQREYTFSGVDNVTWSAVEPNTAWGVRKDGSALVRYQGGKVEDWITAKSLGYDRIDVEAEGEIVDRDDVFAFVRLTQRTGLRFLAALDLTVKKLSETWAIPGTNFDCWAIDQLGIYGVLDTVPPSTEGGTWKIYNIITREIIETAKIGTKHFCTGDGCLIDVNGVYVDLETAKHDDRLKGLGLGVSNGQQANYLHPNYVVWTQGGKSAATKNIGLVSLDGKQFAQLIDTFGGWNGTGEIYASASLAPDGTFYLGYCEGNRTKVAVWRRG